MFLKIGLFILLSLHLSKSFPSHVDVGPCDVFYNEDNTDVTLFCDQKDTTLEQIQTALINLKGQGTIEVELYQVDLNTVPSSFFKGHNIKILTIAFCDLDSLSGGLGRPFEGLEDTLETLMIKGSLKDGHDFEMSSLSHLRRLKEITLHSNTLEELGNNWFKNAPLSLQTISLYENGIKKLGNKAFADVKNLEFLFVNDNQFESFTRSMLPSPSKLYRLELENNAIKSIPEDFFSNMPSLKKISLASNSISKLPENVWRPVWNQLEQIDLSENPLECDSHMDWMSKVTTCAKITATCKSKDEKFDNQLFQKCSASCF